MYYLDPRPSIVSRSALALTRLSIVYRVGRILAQPDDGQAGFARVAPSRRACRRQGCAADWCDASACAWQSQSVAVYRRAGGKFVRAQAGHFQEHSRVAAQIIIAADHGQPQTQNGRPGAPQLTRSVNYCEYYLLDIIFLIELPGVGTTVSDRSALRCFHTIPLSLLNTVRRYSR